ncbi:MAG: efflux RND transporter periplasmic adaptor subunit [Ignavibacteriaceae bacterium]|nr:efflux RND transporter periplasmic adaptor subunit [Ignavibacteriaceae bacterium]
MKKRIKSILIGVIVIVVLLILLLPKFIASGDDTPANSNAARMNMTISVKAHIVKPERLSNTVLSTGSIMANEEVELQSETSGKIISINFKEGSHVTKGDLLVKINDADLQAQLRRAESKVKVAEEKEFRQRTLLERNLISQEEYDNTLNEFNASKADCDLIKAQIEKTEIRAPFSGIVGLRSVSEGSFVNTSTVIARLQNLSNLKIDFSIPERYSSMVRLGDEIEFRVSGDNESYTAKVYAIEPRIDPSTRTLQICAFCRVYKNLIPGAFANVQLKLKETAGAILVPSVSIVPELKGQRVYLYKDGTVVPQNVEIGIREETRVQILSGLNAGDTVITSGILQIRPGAKVSISELN